MCKRKIITLLLLLCFSTLLGYSQPQYILFDKSNLSGSTAKGIPFKNAYIDIKPKKRGEFADLTIYNFKFSHGYQTRYLDNKQVFQHWKKSLKELHFFPKNILITMTPLTRDKFKRVDVTDQVNRGELQFTVADSLLKSAVKEIFYGIYAPLGVLDWDQELKIKRLDFRLVLKERDRYFLIDNETLTEFYYVDYKPIYQDLLTTCGIHPATRNEQKAAYIKGDVYPTGHGKNLYGKILKDSALNIDLKENRYVRFYHFWTNSYVLSFYKYGDRWGQDRAWWVDSGIGDFVYVESIGIINGNFLDYFRKALPTYSADAKTNPQFHLYFETARINGLKARDYLQRYASSKKGFF